MHDYQKNLLKSYMTYDIESTEYNGAKFGEMFVMSSGRQMGKSMLNKFYGTMIPPAFVKLHSADVDGEPWYTISLSKDASIWFRDTQRDSENKLWMDLSCAGYTNVVDMHEKLFTLVQLKWS